MAALSRRASCSAPTASVAGASTANSVPFHQAIVSERRPWVLSACVTRPRIAARERRGSSSPAGAAPRSALNSTHASAACSRSASATTSRARRRNPRSEEHTSELQSPCNLVCRLLLEKKKNNQYQRTPKHRQPDYKQAPRTR